MIYSSIVKDQEPIRGLRHFRCFLLEIFKIAICDLKESYSSSVSWKMNSFGNLSVFLLTCSLRRPVSTIYNSARWLSSITWTPRMVKIRFSISRGLTILRLPGISLVLNLRSQNATSSWVSFEDISKWNLGEKLYTFQCYLLSKVKRGAASVAHPLNACGPAGLPHSLPSVLQVWQTRKSWRLPTADCRLETADWIRLPWASTAWKPWQFNFPGLGASFFAHGFAGNVISYQLPASRVYFLLPLYTNDCQLCPVLKKVDSFKTNQHEVKWTDFSLQRSL